MAKRIDEYTSKSVDSGDEALGVSGGSTRLLELGTAASADVTTSPTDTTSGRVMRVGDGGLLNKGWNVPADSDMNDIFDGATYFFSHTGAGAPANAPIPSRQGAGIQLGAWEPGKSSVQIWVEIGSDSRVFVRSETVVGDNTWNTWREIYHSGNYPSDDSWTTPSSLLNGWAGTVRYIKRAGMVTVLFRVDGSSADNDVLFELPSAYRPDENIDFPAILSYGSNRNVANAIIPTSGQALINSRDSDLRGFVTYPVI